MAVRGLYSAEILAKAMELAAHPWSAGATWQGAARSRSCGSAIELSIETDKAERITAVGVRPHACAVGQAAAAVFVASALGRDRDEIALARAAIADWLAGAGSQPDWPGIEVLGPALAYPARHAAILLAWDAALMALGKAPAS